MPLPRRIGQRNEATRLHVEVLKVREATLGPEHPETLTSMDQIGELYREMDANLVALQLHEKVLEARKRILTPDHPDTLTSMDHVAVMYRKRGYTRESKEAP